MREQLLLLLKNYVLMVRGERTYDNKRTGTVFTQTREGDTSHVTIKGSDSQGIDWIRNIVPPMIGYAFLLASIWNINYLYPAYFFTVVHWGFVHLGIETFIKMDRSAKVYYIFGYSLGGAGVICLGVLLKLSGKKVYCFTAGAPKPFSIFSIFNIVILFFEETIHFQNRKDPVCYILPKWLGWFHVGQIVKPKYRSMEKNFPHHFDNYVRIIKMHS